MRAPRWLRTSTQCRLPLRACLLACAFSTPAPASPQQAAPSILLPSAVAYDSAGNLYFADTNRHQIFEASLDGTLTVVAGTGTQGFAGDGGPATAAQLNGPQGVAISADGTLYIADTGNERIRSVIAGQIATFAGDGAAGYFGDGGSAIAAKFNMPTALAIDPSGALLLCDSANQRVRSISAGLVSTIAGNGLQGFAGDGANATSAELDGPAGIAADSAGRVFIADSRNNRIRVIAANGTISTFAGTGQRGFSGDGGAAISAQLALPRGLMVTSSGALVIADSNNQRLRIIDSQATISTLIGSGVQGTSADGSSASTIPLNTPRGVALSAFGAAVFADAPNHLVRELATNANLYAPAALVAGRVSRVTLTVPASAVYGQLNASAAVSGNVPIPQGTVAVLDGGSPVAQASLTNASAFFALPTLGVGPHSLTIAYAGDGLNPASTSAASTTTITPATAIATAHAATLEYGLAIPPLSGSLTGILPQDAATVSANFTTAAVILSPPAIYPITATLAGPASQNYLLVTSPASGSLQIVQAPSTAALIPPQAAYAGLPLTLTAQVGSTTSGAPTGTVNFLDAGTPIASASIASGTASATYAAPTIGTHTLVASYLGDTNFLPSTSSAVIATVAAMPDFALASVGSTTQTVRPGTIASYTLSVTPQPAPFTSNVSFGVTGLPVGATATFSPAQVVPGASAAGVTLNIQTPNVVENHAPLLDIPPSLLWCILLPLLVGTMRRRGFRKSLAAATAVLALLTTAGCGTRSVTTAATPSSYALTVTATATNLAGATLTHSTQLTLILQ